MYLLYLSGTSHLSCNAVLHEAVTGSLRNALSLFHLFVHFFKKERIALPFFPILCSISACYIHQSLFKSCKCAIFFAVLIWVLDFKWFSLLGLCRICWVSYLFDLSPTPGSWGGQQGGLGAC